MAKPQSAAGRVYRIPEIKKEILSFLEPKDLAVFMRVEKKGMFDVACELYREVKYNFVRLKMSLSTPRQKLYCSAVSHVDATEMTLSPTMLRQLEIDKHVEAGPRKQERIAEWLRTYRIEVINLVVPQLRAKCSGLRSIRFGHTYAPWGTPSWVVRFDSSTPASSSGDWPIDHTHTYCFRGDAKPWKKHRTPPTPSPQYTVRSRFDLRLDAIDPSLFEEWLQCLDTSSCYDDVYLHAAFGNLPIPLPLITSLYARQAVAHGARLLSSVDAPRIVQWLPSEFVTFAQTAAAVSATDLPSFVATVRNHLPRLTWLSFALADISHAEEVVCVSNLSATAFDHGPLTHLRIYIAKYRKPLFNLIRTLAPVCYQSGAIIIYRANAPEDAALVFGKAQTRFLHYLKKQTPARQKHLAIADFSLLGIDQYKDVLELKYRKDGGPIKRGETLAAGWVKQADDAMEVMSDWKSAMRRFARAAERYRAMAASKTATEMGRQADELLVLSDAVDEAARRLRSHLPERRDRRDHILQLVGDPNKRPVVPSPAPEEDSASESDESELTELEE